MGFQKQICSILRFSWSILGCVYSTGIACFVIDSSRLFAFCLVSVIRKQWLDQCNYSNVQSALMTGFQTDLTSLTEFLSLNRRRTSSRNVPRRRWARRNVCRLQANLNFSLIHRVSTPEPWVFLGWGGRLILSHARYRVAVSSCVRPWSAHVQ